MLVFFLFNYYQEGSRNIIGLKDGFCGLKEAGQWIKNNINENEQIIGGSVNQLLYYSNHDQISEFPRDKEAFEAMIQHNASYVIIDIWERTQPDFIYPLDETKADYLEKQGFRFRQAIPITYRNQEIPAVFIFKKATSNDILTTSKQQ